MWRKVYLYFFTFRCNHVNAEKTAPEPELELNPEPELKPKQEDELEPNSEPEEEVDPIAMLAALPKATNGTDRFNPKLSPILEIKSEYFLSEENIAQKRHKGWVKWLTEQMFCNVAPPHSGYLEKSNSAELEDKKIPLSMVCLFKPKCGALPKPNQRLRALSKPNRCLRSDILNTIRILKARYRGGATRSQDKELVLTWNKKKKF